MFNITKLSKPQVEAILQALSYRIQNNKPTPILGMVQLEGAIKLLRQIEDETRLSV